MAKIIGSAAFDDTKTYRYVLSRAIGDAPPRPRRVLWVLLNPSTATAAENDPTIRRCMGYSEAWDFGRMDVVNLFALRSTDPSALKAHVDPVGPENDRFIHDEAVVADMVICAWGVHGTLGDRDRLVGDILIQAAPHKLHVLGVTNGGHPKHPLYLPKTLTPQSWVPSHWRH